MDAFNVNISYDKQDIIDALIDVFGMGYTSMIINRFNNIYLVPYVNYNGAHSYHRFLMSSKSRMMCIKFLKIIGIDVDKYNVTSFADDFPKELEELCEGLFGGSWIFEKIMQDTPVGCKSFSDKYNQGYTNDYILEHKIKFINAVKKDDIETVTEENYDEFVDTLEYKRIEALALYYCGIYEGLLIQMNEYLETIKEYETYYRSENERKRKLYNDYRLVLFKVLEDSLRGKIKEAIDKEDAIGRKACALISNSIEYKSSIEYFSTEDENKLNNPDTSDFEKEWILRYRMSFLQSMGVDLDPFKDDYYEVIKRDGVKDFIPYSVFADEVTRLRKYYLEEVNEKFIKESDSYNKTMSYFGKCEANERAVYETLKSTKVCVNAGHDNNNVFRPIIYFTIRDWQCGCMDYVLIHEIIHAIECVSYDGYNYSCGFESQMVDPPLSELEHSEEKRKYERFNEVIVDLLSKEVVDLLHKRKVYIIDDELRTLSDFSKFNTSKILKDLVRPFYQQYRDLIIEARMSGKMFLLTHYVGEDNFEELNSVVDYVDLLVEKGLKSKLENNEVDDPLVIDYYLQLEKVKRIYQDMADTYNREMRPRGRGKSKKKNAQL